MDLLITYDVETVTVDGQRRLRRVAKLCEAHGIRVQKSVFEVVCTEPQLLRLEHALNKIIDAEADSVRIYKLSDRALQLVRHLGASQPAPHRGDHIV
jgi:CRISPR-associated protein Cas2